jgi:hypothetical protein
MAPMQPAKLEVDEPLGAGEVLATAFREYGRKPITYVAIGAIEALSGLTTHPRAGIPTALGIAIVAAAFVVCFVATVCVASGWSFPDARVQAGNAVGALAGLVIIIGVPQSLGRVDVFFVLVAILWLAVTSSAIPTVMLEQRIGHPVKLPGMFIALRRALSLAQLAFWHALAVVFILFVVTLLITSVLGAALASFGDQSELAALVISRAVLIPVMFIGLVVLYLDQRARALASAEEPAGQPT